MSGSTLFIARLSKHWHRLTRKAVVSISLEMLKSHLDMVLGHDL